MKPAELGALVLLGAIWGASFLFIRVSAPAFGPLLLMFCRVVLAGLVLLAYAAMIRRVPDIRSRWRVFLIAGSLSSAIPFTLIAWSELTLSVSLASIINSMTPLFTAVIASAWGDERLTARKLIGVILGIIGVMVLVGGSPLEMNANLMLSALASVLASLSYGFGVVYASRYMSDLSPLHATIGMMAGAGVVLALPAAAAVPAQMPALTPLLSFLALVLLSTSFAYLLYFYLLSNVGATRAITVTFLVPVFGTIWGALFLHEILEPVMLLGMLIVLTSVGLVVSGRYRKPQLVLE